MTKREIPLIAGLLACLVILSVGCLGFFYIDRNQEKELDIRFNTAVHVATEYGYSEGQIDALKGDTRIAMTDDSCFHWIKSPWDDGKQPLYSIPQIKGKDSRPFPKLGPYLETAVENMK